MSGPETRKFDETDRLEAFSDGVMAVIITIMAFNVKTPDGATFSALRVVLPQLLVYVLSFTMIAIYWNNHHHLLRATERMDALVMWSNMFLLFWLSLVPIVTNWVGHFPNHALPAAAYGLILFGAGAVYTVLVRTIVRVNGRRSAVGRAVGRNVKGYVSMVLYATGTAMAFLTPIASYLLYGVVALLWLAPDPRFLRPRVTRPHFPTH